MGAGAGEGKRRSEWRSRVRGNEEGGIGVGRVELGVRGWKWKSGCR